MASTSQPNFGRTAAWAKSCTLLEPSYATACVGSTSGRGRAHQETSKADVVSLEFLPTREPLQVLIWPAMVINLSLIFGLREV